MPKLIMFLGIYYVYYAAYLTGVLFPDLDIALLFSLDMGAGLTQISGCLGETNYNSKTAK